MLKLHRRRQNNVGEFGRVGHKMFYYDCEEIRARQPLSDLVLPRNTRERIAPVDEESFDWRVVQLEQSFAELRHVQRSRGARSQIIAAQRRQVPAEETARVVTGAAAGITPVASDAGYTGDRTHGHAASAVAL